MKQWIDWVLLHTCSTTRGNCDRAPQRGPFPLFRALAKWVAGTRSTSGRIFYRNKTSLIKTKYLLRHND